MTGSGDLHQSVKRKMFQRRHVQSRKREKKTADVMFGSNSKTHSGKISSVSLQNCRAGRNLKLYKLKTDQVRISRAERKRSRFSSENKQVSQRLLFGLTAGLRTVEMDSQL